MALRVSMNWTAQSIPPKDIKRCKVVWNDEGNPAFVMSYYYDPVSDRFYRAQHQKSGSSSWWVSSEGLGR